MRVLPPPAPPPPASREAIDAIINLAHPAVEPRDATLIQRLQKLRESYLRQGRGREAHAIARATLLAWHTIIATAGAEQLTETRPAPLDLLLP